MRCKLPTRQKRTPIRVHTETSPGNTYKQHRLPIQHTAACFPAGRGGGRWIRTCFIFTKKKNGVDGGEVDEQVLTGELLYNNEDCAIKPMSKCQKKKEKP